MVRKYYVVFEGKTPGIYDSWPDCKQQVCGVSGNTYKGYDTLDEAREAFKKWETRLKKPTPIDEGNFYGTRSSSSVNASVQVNEEANEVKDAFYMGMVMGSLLASTLSATKESAKEYSDESSDIIHPRCQ